jgi:N-acetyl-gamma-glutamyl-phosphate reductase
MKYAGLREEPYFVPAVGPFRCGMRVQLLLHRQWLRAAAEEIGAALAERYRGQPFVRVFDYGAAAEIDERTLSPLACNDTNRIDLHAIPHPSGHVLLAAILDNLGKGAAGVAIQNLNLMLGLPAATGLPS